MPSNIYSADDALQLVWSPLRGVPTEQGDKTVTTTSTTLFADLSNVGGYGARRCRVYNTDNSNVLGLVFLAAGASVASLSLSSSTKVAGGSSYEFVISNSIRVGCISAATITVNVLVHDLV